MRAVLVSLVLFLAACGGGGGGGGSLNVSFPTPLRESLYPSQLPQRVYASAKVSGGTSASILYVKIFQPAGIFLPNATQVFIDPPDYSIGLVVAPDVPVGVHTGTVEVKICTDEPCAQVLSSSTLPYEITIKAPQVTLESDSLAGATMQQDGIVEFPMTVREAPDRATLYLQLSDSAGTFETSQAIAAPYGAFYGYNFLLPTKNGLPATARSGSLAVKLCADAACAQQYAALTVPYTLQVYALATSSFVHSFAFDSKGTLYTATVFDIHKTSSSGTRTKLFEATGNQSIGSIAADESGNVFFEDSSEVIYKLPPSGEAESFGYGRVGDLAMGQSGNLYYSAADYNSFSGWYLPDGRSRSWSVSPPRESGGYSLGVDSRDKVYLAGDYNVYSLTSDSIFADHGRFENPRDVAVNAADVAFVIDSLGVHKIVPGGAIRVARYPRLPLTPNQMGYGTYLSPFRIAFAPDGRLFLSDGSQFFMHTRLPD